METNINAFYMDVDEKKAAVVAAKAELERSEEALKAHPDFEEPKAHKAPKEDASDKKEDEEYPKKDEPKESHTEAKNDKSRPFSRNFNHKKIVTSTANSNNRRKAKEKKLWHEEI